jgi:hypothetical protein
MQLSAKPSHFLWRLLCPLTMVLLIAIGVAAAAYAGKSSSSDNDAHFDLDLDGLTAVDLLPVERTLAIFESPITTVTHMEGDPKEAADYLRKRVDEIVCQNPWLGGWLAKDKKDGAVKLFYDPSGEKLAPDLFRSFEPLEIPLSRDTSFVLQREILEKAAPGVKVKQNAEVIGRNDGLWRVSLIPDSDMPTERFALVVSQSHMLGDGHTFFAAYNMLNNDSPIVSLNPKRNFKWIKDVEETMGIAETYYINTIAKSPLWARFLKDETIIDTRVFFLNEEWVEGQKMAWAAVAAAEAAVENSETSRKVGPARSDYAVSFASPLSAMSLSTNDVVTCWFYRLVDATVGLMAYNFRGRLESCGDDDAGCYSCAIPYTAEDYETPTLIQQSRTSARRAYADRHENPTTLPSHSRDSTCKCA